MLRRFALLALLTACASPAPFDAVAANIRYGTARDGDNSWPERRELLADYLLAASPEILGVQEALESQLGFLSEHFPHHACIGTGRDGGTRGEHAALFIDERTFEILDHGDFWLSETPDTVASRGWDAALPRICTWAHLRHRANGRTVHVWNLHYDHRGRIARLESSRLMARRIDATPGPHIVLGDLNAGEHSPPLHALRAAGLRDTFRDIHPEATEVGTFHGFRGGTTGAKIDYVLASSGLMTIDAELLTEPDAATGRWPSDHHFVAARLGL